MSDEPETSSETIAAKKEAIHAAKNAQAAVEIAREIELAEVVEKTALRTKTALLEGLKEVFGESDVQDSEQMRVLVRRIPILCTNIERMHDDIAEIKDNNRWIVRIVVGAVVLAVLKLVIIP